MTQSSVQTPMSFGAAIGTAFRKYATFDGRATRAEFWWFILFTVLVGSALGAFNVGTPTGEITLGTSLASVWSIVTFVPSLAVAVRRLRDAGRRWPELFWILLPIAGIIVLVMRWCEPTWPDGVTQ
jgi:uncharacterized membrane protein YhaH (DUF805 family)